MKAYLIVTGATFGLITVAHILRVAAEGTHPMTEPVFVASTVLAAVLCFWACRLLRKTPGSSTP